MKILLNLLVYFGIILFIGAVIILRQKFFPKIGDIQVVNADFQKIIDFKKKKNYKIKFKVHYPEHLICSYNFTKETEYYGLIDDPKYNILFQTEKKNTYIIPIKKNSDVLTYEVTNSYDFDLASDIIDIFTEKDNYK